MTYTRALQLRRLATQLPRIAEVLASLRGVAVDELARMTSANAKAALPRLASLSLSA